MRSPIKPLFPYVESIILNWKNTRIFMKGANYIPQSSFPGIVKDDQYKKVISDALAANMNMLRVWGGGIYEKDSTSDLFLVFLKPPS